MIFVFSPPSSHLKFPMLYSSICNFFEAYEAFKDLFYYFLYIVDGD